MFVVEFVTINVAGEHLNFSNDKMAIVGPRKEKVAPCTIGNLKDNVIRD